MVLMRFSMVADLVRQREPAESSDVPFIYGFFR